MREQYASLTHAQAALSLDGGILELSPECNVNFCRDEDDAVVVQVGVSTAEGVFIDSELAANLLPLHRALVNYFDGGFHNGITMLKVTFTDNGYLVVGDDMDDADATVSFEADSVTSLLEQVSKLN